MNKIMKKFVLLLVTLLSTIVSYSQDFYKITHIATAVYKGEKWVTDEEQDVTSDVYLMFDGGKVKLAGTKYEYRCVGQGIITEKDECTIYRWDAYDNDGDKCIVALMKCQDNVGNRSTVLSILYTDRNEAIKFQLSPEAEK